MRVEQRTVSVFIADDGMEFRTEQEAIRHEVLVQICEQIEVLIGPRVIDPTGKFANGGGYVQREGSRVNEARNLFQRLWRQCYSNGSVDPLPLPANRVQMRLQSIDSDNREWGQPAFSRGGGKSAPWPQP